MQLFSKIFNLYGHDPPMSQMDRQTDRQTCDSKTTLCTVVHSAVKSEWWGAGVVICLGRSADLHTAQLMPLPLTISCSSKSTLVPICYRLTQVVPDKGMLNGCCCGCCFF